MNKSYVFGLTAIFLVIMATSGCIRVKPWERDILANKIMTFDAEQDEATLDHTYYNAREGTAGGFDAGGGGCGCN